MGSNGHVWQMRWYSKQSRIAENPGFFSGSTVFSPFDDSYEIICITNSLSKVNNLNRGSPNKLGDQISTTIWRRCPKSPTIGTFTRGYIHQHPNIFHYQPLFDIIMQLCTIICHEKHYQPLLPEAFSWNIIYHGNTMFPGQLIRNSPFLPSLSPFRPWSGPPGPRSVPLGRPALGPWPTNIMKIALPYSSKIYIYIYTYIHTGYDMIWYDMIWYDICVDMISM